MDAKRIVVIADTHAQRIDQLPTEMLTALQSADVVVHCGDFTGVTLLEELQFICRELVAVHGNTDSREVRELLPDKAVLEVHGRKIGITHPSWGGAPFGIAEKLAAQFQNVDAILFGHTHDSCNLTQQGILFLNPGQGYASFRVPASLGILTISNGEMSAEIVHVN